MNVNDRSWPMNVSGRRDQSRLTLILKVDNFQNSSTKTQPSFRVKSLQSIWNKCIAQNQNSGYPQGITVVVWLLFKIVFEYLVWTRKYLNLK